MTRFANFDEWWDKFGGAMKPKPDEDPATHARRVTHVAWARAEEAERRRCVDLICNLQDTRDTDTDHIYHAMSENRVMFDAGLQAIIELTKESAVQAILCTPAPPARNDHADQ